jgi:MFS family permease
LSLTDRADAPINISSRFPFYYGWVVMVILAIFNTIAGSIGGSRVALFIKPMGEDLGWSVAVFGWAQMAGMLTIVVSGPFLGQLIDRYGPRILVPVAAFFGGLAVTALAFVGSPWQMVLIFGFAGLIGLGQAGELYGNVVISKWFVKKRGKALGIGFAFITIGLVVFMPLTQWLIDEIGWAKTWIILGLSGPVVVVPLALIFLRRQPEDLGLLPDGERTDIGESDEGRGEPENDERSWTRSEAIRTPVFWLMVLGFGVAGFATSIQAVFRIPHFVERGIDAQLVAFAVSADAIAAGVVAAFIAGRLSDRFSPRYMAMLGFLILINAALFTVIGDTVSELYIAFLSFGIAMAFIMVAQNVLWANIFGREHLGSIRGITVPLIMVISATAFPLTGYIRDEVGNYTPAWWISAAGLILAFIIISRVRAPSDKTF